MWLGYYVLASGGDGTTDPDMIARHSPPLLGRAAAGDCGSVNFSVPAGGGTWDRDIGRGQAAAAARSRIRSRLSWRRARSIDRPWVATRLEKRGRHASFGGVWVRRFLRRGVDRLAGFPLAIRRRAAPRRASACSAVPRWLSRVGQATGSAMLSSAVVIAPRQESTTVTTPGSCEETFEEGPTVLSSAIHMPVRDLGRLGWNVRASPWLPSAASSCTWDLQSPGVTSSCSNANSGSLQDPISRPSGGGDTFVEAPEREAPSAPEEPFVDVVVAGVVGEEDAGHIGVDETLCHDCDEEAQDGGALPAPPEPRAPPLRAKQRGRLSSHVRFLQHLFRGYRRAPAEAFSVVSQRRPEGAGGAATRDDISVSGGDVLSCSRGGRGTEAERSGGDRALFDLCGSAQPSEEPPGPLVPPFRRRRCRCRGGETCSRRALRERLS